MHKVVQYLQTNSVSSLESIGVYANWSKSAPNKFTLNYDQIEAENGNELVELCRGAVFVQLSGDKGEPGKYQIVAHPFRRFYNFGQGFAAAVDFDKVSFVEKVDGTLIILYFYDGKWNVATRGTPDADIPCADGETFAEKAFRHIDAERLNKMSDSATSDDLDPKKYTFLLEYCGPDNQIAGVYYEEKQLILLGTIRTETGEEVEFLHHDNYHWRAPRKFEFDSLAAATEWVHQQSGTALEGFVAVDSSYNRVKIKNAQYLHVAKILTNAGSDKGLLAVILADTMDDIEPYLHEERKQRMFLLREKLHSFLHGAGDLIASLKLLPTRKEAAITIQNSSYKRWVGLLLDVWSGKSDNVLSGLRRQKTNHGVIPDSLLESLLVDLLK